MAATGRALVPFVPQDRPKRAWLRAAALVALFGVTAGVGAGATFALRHALPRWGVDPASQTALNSLREQVKRLTAEMAQVRATEAAKPDDATKPVRRAVDALRADVEQLRAATAAAGPQAASRIDKLEGDTAARSADLSARIDRLERDTRVTAQQTTASTAHAGIDKDPVGTVPQPAASADPAKLASKPAEVAAVQAPAPTQAPAKASAPVAAAPMPALAPAVPMARPGTAALQARGETTAVPGAAAAPLRGWVLRDVYDGLAVVQARGGEIREIGPGEYLPGAGEVRSIQRRGRAWVVLTSRGVIEAAAY